MSLSELFWEAPIPDLKQGYTFDADADAFICLICGKQFEQGVIFPQDGKLYEAGKFVRIHIESIHGSMFEYLLGLDKKLTGLTDLQKKLLMRFHAGLPDREIARELDSGSTSTIRNHRFALRERMKQARLFLAIMELAEVRGRKPDQLLPIHRSATMVDERYAITEQENADVLRQYFPQGTDGPLAGFPRKEKRKIIILRQLVRLFAPGRTYTEQEVNDALKRKFDDFATLRRYLIEYGFMDRLPDGGQYWVKE